MELNNKINERKKMKKITMFLVFYFSFAMDVFGKEITYYHMFSKNTPTLAQTEIIVESLKSISDIDFKQGMACSVKNKFDRDTSPAIVEIATGRYWYTLQSNDELCNIDLKSVRWLGGQKLTYNLCVKNDSKVQNNDDLLKLDIRTAGFASGSHGGHWLEKLNIHYNTKLKAIEYPNSGGAVIALISGEVDVAIISDVAAEKQEINNTIRCLGTTDQNSEKSLSKIFPKIPKAISDSGTIFAIGIKNVSDNEYKSFLLAMQKAKIVLDKNFPSNKFYIIDNKKNTEESFSKEINQAIFGLYQATK